MHSWFSWLEATGLCLVLATALLAGCKQGVNEVCQVNSDCEDGLICNRVQGICQTGATGGSDAAPTPEADAAPEPTFDASPADASPADASPADASPADASPADASALTGTAD